MANENLHPRIVPKAGEVPGLIYGFTEADSQTFVPGNLVYISAAGTLTECTSDDTTYAGIAAKAATNVTSGNIEIPFWPFYPDTLVQFTVSGSTALSFDSATYYNTVLTSSVHYLDSTDSGAGTDTAELLLPLYYIKDALGDNTSQVVCALRGEPLDFNAVTIT